MSFRGAILSRVTNHFNLLSPVSTSFKPAPCDVANIGRWPLYWSQMWGECLVYVGDKSIHTRWGHNVHQYWQMYTNINHCDIGHVVCVHFIWSILSYTRPTLALDNIHLEGNFMKYVKENSHLDEVVNVYMLRSKPGARVLLGLTGQYAQQPSVLVKAFCYFWKR